MNKFFQFLGLTKKSGNLVEGYNKCEDTIKKQKVYLCILSLECADNTKSKFIKYSNDRKIPLIENINSKDLAIAIGREEINVLMVKDENMSKKLIKLWNDNQKT